MAASSALLFLPRFFGAGAGAGSAATSSLLVALAAAFLPFVPLTSKFSPSEPFTVYTLSVSFFTILVLFLLDVVLAADSSAALSKIAYTTFSSWSLGDTLMPNSLATVTNLVMSIDSNSSFVYILLSV